MDDRRLTQWLESNPVLPDTGRIGVFNAWPEIDLPGVDPDRIRAVQPMAAEHAALAARGLKTAKVVNYYYGAVILRIPREKDRALGYLLDAVRRVGDRAPVIIDGQKTDGIESILKLCQDRFAVRDVISKAHGKLFWFRKRGLSGEAVLHLNPFQPEAEEPVEDIMRLQGLPEPGPRLMPFGFHTAPGVFSADGPDPASDLLAASLPPLTGRVADLGAGWGYLAHRILETGQPAELHLVEADWVALTCAKENVKSDLAHFHWADVTTWSPPDRMDHVVTNPPFHHGRAADPEIGRTFIRAAAAMLKPKGQLWLVANRHLPYEKTLSESFRDIAEIGGSGAFKLLHAAHPRHPGRGKE